MKDQVLLIITGLPYSGKSTLTKKLVKKFSFIIASVDQVLDEENYVVEDMKQKDWDHVYSQAFKRLGNYLKQGISVIFDGGSLLKSERDTLKDIAKKHGVYYKLIYLNTPIDLIKKRWFQNLKEKTRVNVEKKTLEKAISMFEEPGEDEEMIIYNPDTDFENWVAEYL